MVNSNKIEKVFGWIKNDTLIIQFVESENCVEFIKDYLFEFHLKIDYVNIDFRD